jgi:hypothetical protein
VVLIGIDIIVRSLKKALAFCKEMPGKASTHSCPRG